MRLFLFMLALLLSVQGAQTASVEHALSEAVPEQDAPWSSGSRLWNRL